VCVSALDTDSAGATQTDAARLHLNWFALKESKWSSTRLETARVRFSNGKNRSLSLSLSLGCPLSKLPSLLLWFKGNRFQR